MKKFKLIFTTVFLGAVGSGVWQYFLSPIFNQATNIILNIATLGLSSYKNALYADVAKGFHEYASYSLQSKVNIIFAMIIVMAVFELRKRAQAISDDRRDMLERLDDLDDLEAGRLDERLTIAEIRSRVNEVEINKTIGSIKIMIPIAVILFSAEMVSSYSNLYENRAITYYQQSKAIIAPFVTEDEIIRLDANFSSIKTADEYYFIVAKLEEIALVNNVELPKFEPW